MSSIDDLDERFRQLENEVNAKTNAQTNETMRRAEPERRDETPLDASAVKYSLASLVGWINGLTGATKVVAIAVVGVIAISLIGFVLKLVSLAITLGIVAVVGYVLYKVFFESNSSEKP